MNRPTIKVPSPEIDPLIGLRGYISGIRKSIGPDFAPFFFKPPVCILDSSFVISDLRRHAQGRKDTALIVCLKHGVIKAIAPHKLREEVQAKLDQISEETRVESEQLLNAWTDHYQPFISFIEASDEHISTLLKTLRDPNDRDFIRAHESAKADYVLADDLDIRILGISPANPVQFLIDLRHYARGQAFQMTMVFGGGLITVGIVGTGVAVFKMITKVIQTVNSRFPWLFPTLFLAVGAVALHPQGREFLKKQASKISQTITEVLAKAKKGTFQIKEDFIDQYGDSLLAANSARKRLVESPSANQSLNKVVEYLARALAESFTPLSVPELSEYVQRLGYKPRGLSFIVYLRKVLRSNSKFKQLPSGQWTLA